MRMLRLTRRSTAEIGRVRVVAAVLPIVRAVSRDKSWRVRYVVAENFCALVERLGVDVTRVEMVPTFVALLQDGEAEVRTAAAFNSTSFAAMLLSETVLTHMLPCYRDLSNDTSPHVRRSSRDTLAHNLRCSDLNRGCPPHTGACCNRIGHRWFGTDRGT